MPIGHAHRAVIPVPCLAYLGDIREKDPDAWVTASPPEVIPARGWPALLHKQRALILRAALRGTPGAIDTAPANHLKG